MSVVSTILTGIGYRLSGGITISSTSDPSQAACLQWLNETALWITGICAEQDSDLGRTIGTITTLAPAITAATAANPCSVTSVGHGLVSTDEILIKSVVGMTELNDTEFTFTRTSADAGTLGVDSSAYTTYSSGGYMYKRKYSTLATALLVPGQEGWVVDDHSRNPIKLITEKELINYDPLEAVEPSEFYVDGSNNICFPSYPDDVYTIKIPYWTIPTALTTTADTMPFLGLMDNVFIEAVAIRAQNRDEYDTLPELKWMSYLQEGVRRVIAMRKKMNISVGL
jgi:hypothetical protein